MISFMYKFVHFFPWWAKVILFATGTYGWYTFFDYIFKKKKHGKSTTRH